MNKKRTLYLSENKFLGGVVAGCAEYFDHDPTIWRLGSIVFLIITGLMPGVLLYFLAWLVMPRKSSGIHEAEYRVINDEN